MAIAEIEACSGGGGAEWITATISGTSFSATWDYDADTIIILNKADGARQIVMYDVATADLWYAQEGYAQWTHYGVDSRVTITPRSIIGNWSVPLADMSIIPIKGKPIGYYT